MPNPVMISVAPNGARKTKADHPRLPITPDELAATARQCQAAGAVMIHLHVRDKNEAHSLDPELYLPAIAKVRAAVGDEMVIQITTESVNQYSIADQIACVKKVRPEAVSLALRELIPNPGDDLEAARFFEWLQAQSIAPQFILYSIAEINHFNELCRRGAIQSDRPNILLVLGKHADEQQSDSVDLLPLLTEVNPDHVWSLCAFGQTEATCMSEAINHGGHCRIGFENNLVDAEGALASSNESQVAALVDKISHSKRPLANINEARRLLGVLR